MPSTKNSKILHDRELKVIGLGGIGTPVAQALAQFLAFRSTRCKMWLIDGDRYMEHNKERVLFFAELDNKAVVKAQELSHALEGRIGILPVPKYVTPKNIRQMITEGDILFLCVDNHATRKLVGDRCRKLKDVVLISGGNDGIEEGRTGTFGNVQVFLRCRGRDLTNPLTRFHQELARPRDKRPDELGCAELIQQVPQLVFTNLAVASAMLGTFYAWLSGTLNYEELYLDILHGHCTPVRRAVEERPSRRNSILSKGRRKGTVERNAS